MKLKNSNCEEIQTQMMIKLNTQIVNVMKPKTQIAMKL